MDKQFKDFYCDKCKVIWRSNAWTTFANKPCADCPECHNECDETTKVPMQSAEIFEPVTCIAHKWVKGEQGNDQVTTYGFSIENNKIFTFKIKGEWERIAFEKAMDRLINNQS